MPVRATGGGAVAIAVAATAAMWTVCYGAMMQPGLVIGEALFVLLLVVVATAGFAAGRHTLPGRSAALSGVRVGLTIGLLNLLIVGSLLTDPQTHALRPGALMWIAGDLLLTPLLAGAGALAGSVGRSTATPAGRNWLNTLTWSASVTVFLLLITGGLVTGLEAGMAVEDWPNSFGHNMFLLPLAQMKGGVFFEHAHRLYGALVGLTSIILMVALLRMERRGLVRALGVALLAAVCVQGVLGGTRVLQISITLAIAHGIFAQLVFAAFVALTALTSSAWNTLWPGDSQLLTRAERLGSTHLFRTVVAQLVLGALYRHLQAHPGVIKPVMHSILGLHILVAVAVLAGGILVGARAWGRRNEAVQCVPVSAVGTVQWIARRRGVLGLLLMALVCVQVVLGIVSLALVMMRQPADGGPIPLAEVAFTSAHHGVGALILAVSTLLMLWTRRLAGPPMSAPAEAAAVQ